MGVHSLWKKCPPSIEFLESPSRFSASEKNLSSAEPSLGSWVKQKEREFYRPGSAEEGA